ncbi:MAG: glycosyltransferase family 2 protein [Bacteroidales bacterium]|nr:glycosyltransferase family 2 protein [Bacteroidales bacterium]
MVKVSIISPVYKVAPYIGECIQSLKAQRFQDFEVLFVDDHSPDDSIAVARSAVGEDARFRFVCTPQNGGPGAARNLGIELAQGEYIAFIDSDDVWHPEFLSKMLEAAKGNDLTYCQLQYRGGNREGEVFRNPVLPTGIFSPERKKFFLKRFVTFSVCFLFRRKFLVENDLRFPTLRNSEDTHFLTRCLLLAQTVACVDVPLYYYCLRQASLSTHRDWRKYRQRLAAIRSLRRAYENLCRNPRYADLRLSQYRGVMRLIYFKKGYAQALRDIVQGLF